MIKKKKESLSPTRVQMKNFITEFLPLILDYLPSQQKQINFHVPLTKFTFISYILNF